MDGVIKKFLFTPQTLRWTSGVLASLFVVALYATQTGGAAVVTPTQIGFIGDSITQGPKDTPTAVDAETAMLGGTYAAINRGMSGSTTKEWQPGHPMFDDALAQFTAHRARTVSIMLGTNDARDTMAVAPVTYKKNMQTIIDALLHSGNVDRVIINYPPYAVPGSGGDTWTAASSRRLEAYMTQIDVLVDSVRVVRGDTDAYAYFKAHPDELTDGIHPTKAGYKQLGQLWARAYVETLPKRTSFFGSPSHLL